MISKPIAIAVVLLLFTPLVGQGAEEHPEWPGKGQLFVGTCYQPVDRSPEQIRSDVALMKQAGFTLVRMGDLSWDAFEPAEGQIRVRLVRRHPEPDERGGNQGDSRHRRIAGADLAAPSSTRRRIVVNEQRRDAVSRPKRYMDDISDPDVRRAC